MRQIINYIIIFVFAGYILWLNYSGKLNFYIHPRYTDFAVTMSWIALVFCLGFAARWLEYRLGKARGHEHPEPINRGALISWLIIGIALVLGLGLAVKPLSVATAQQRAIDLNSLRANEASTADLFIRNTKNYSLGDWIVSLNSNPDLQKYVGKQVKLSGFIFSPENSSQYFHLSRFAITCCAVDARPIGLKVRYDWFPKFSQNQWVEVEGEFITSDDSEYPELLIKPTSIKSIEVPAEPYIF